jgi:prevent-host-death family protein
MPTLAGTLRETTVQTFTIRDLRDRTGDLVREAESGNLSVVTRHGQPIFIAVPFDEGLLREGVTLTLATRLFDDEAISLGKAARLAGLPVAEFYGASEPVEYSSRTPANG